MRCLRTAALLLTALAALLMLTTGGWATAFAAPREVATSGTDANPPTAIRVQSVVNVRMAYVDHDTQYTLINRSDRPQPIRLRLGSKPGFSRIDFDPLTFGPRPADAPTALPTSLSVEEDASGYVWLVGQVPAASEVGFTVRSTFPSLMPNGGGFGHLRELLMQCRVTVYEPSRTGDWPLTGLVLRVNLPGAGAVIPNDPRRGGGEPEAAYLSQPAWQAPVNRLCVRDGPGPEAPLSFPEPTYRSNPTLGASGNETSEAVWELPDLVTNREVTYDLYISRPVRAGLSMGWAAALGIAIAAIAFASGIRWHRWRTDNPDGAVALRRKLKRVALPAIAVVLVVSLFAYAGLQLYWGYRSPVISADRSAVLTSYMAAKWQPGEQVNFTFGLLNRSHFPARISGIRAISLEHGRDLPLAGAVTASGGGYAGVGPLDMERVLKGWPVRPDAGSPAIGARILPGDGNRLAIAISVRRPEELTPPIDIGEIEITYTILGIRHHVYVQYEEFGVPAPKQGEQ